VGITGLMAEMGGAKHDALADTSGPATNLRMTAEARIKSELMSDLTRTWLCIA